MQRTQLDIPNPVWQIFFEWNRQKTNILLSFTK